MTIALRAAGTATSATAAVTAVNPAVPSGAVVGDLSVLLVYVKPYSTTITDPSGWTKIGEHTNGTTATGTDTGSTKVLVFVKEDAAVGAIGNISQSGANTMGAVINVYSKTKSTWDYSSFTQGFDSSNGANYSATGDAGISVAAGDMVVAGTAINGDIGTLSAWAIAGMSGATLGTSTNRTNAAVTTGNDCRGTFDEVAITAGSSSAAPTYAYTNASSTSGTTMWLRLRETTVSSVVRQTITSGADNDTATAGNTGATSVVATGGTAVIDTGVVYSPTRSVLMDGTSTSGGVYLQVSIPQSEVLAADIYVYWNALPSAVEPANLGWYNGATRGLSVGTTDTGAIRLRDAAGGGGTNIWTSTATMTTGQWYRISLYATQHASTGTARAALFPANSATPLDDSTLLTGKNTGASPYNSLRFGLKGGTGTQTLNGNMDDYAYDRGASDLIPPEPFIVDLDADGIASAEAFGTVEIQTVSNVQVDPTAIASAEAFGTAVISTPITLTPDAIASAEAFGTVSVTTPITLTPTGIASAEVVPNPTVIGPVTAEPTGIASAEAFGTAVITGLIVLTVNAIGSAEALGSPTITATITLTPTGIASAEAFGTPVISTTLQASPNGIASAEAFGTAVIGGTLTVSPGGIASAEAFGTPAIGVGTDAQPTGIASAEAFGTVFIEFDQTLSPTGISSAEVVPSVVITGSLTSQPTGIASGETFGTPTISGVLNVDLMGYGIGSHETVMAPTLTHNLIVTPNGLASAEAFGTATVSYGAITIMAPSIQTQEAFGVVVVGGGNTFVYAEPALSAEAFGVPYVIRWVPYPPQDDHPFSVVETTFHPFSVVETWMDPEL